MVRRLFIGGNAEFDILLPESLEDDDDDVVDPAFPVLDPLEMELEEILLEEDDIDDPLEEVPFPADVDRPDVAVV